MNIEDRLAALRETAAASFAIGDPVNVAYSDGHVYKAFVQQVKGAKVYVTWTGKFAMHPAEWVPAATCKPVGKPVGKVAKTGVQKPPVAPSPSPALETQGFTKNIEATRAEIEKVYLKATNGRWAQQVTLDKIRNGVAKPKALIDAAFLKIIQGDKGQPHRATLGQLADTKRIPAEVQAAAFAPAGEPFHIIYIERTATAGEQMR